MLFSHSENGLIRTWLFGVMAKSKKKSNDTIERTQSSTPYCPVKKKQKKNYTPVRDKTKSPQIKQPWDICNNTGVAPWQCKKKKKELIQTGYKHTNMQGARPFRFFFLCPSLQGSKLFVVLHFTKQTNSQRANCWTQSYNTNKANGPKLTGGRQTTTKKTRSMVNLSHYNMTVINKGAGTMVIHANVLRASIGPKIQAACCVS